MIKPNWPAPTWVHAITTTQKEADQRVLSHRVRLRQQLNLPSEPFWLNQTHSTRVLQLQKSNLGQTLEVDGSWTNIKKIPCVVLTADCLPLLLCDTAGTLVGAIHCGWRGILNGIIENAIQNMQPHTQDQIIAWLGPAIGPEKFEVGEEVRDQFVQQDLQASYAFKVGDRQGKWMGNLYQLARIRLNHCGITQIYGGQFCTYGEERFYSFRRDKNLGRMATIIWLDP